MDSDTVQCDKHQIQYSAYGHGCPLCNLESVADPIEPMKPNDTETPDGHEPKPIEEESSAPAFDASGGPAFPQVQLVSNSKTGQSFVVPAGGMSVRTYMAIEFMKAAMENGQPEEYTHNSIVALRAADNLIVALATPKKEVKTS